MRSDAKRSVSLPKSPPARSTTRSLPARPQRGPLLWASMAILAVAGVAGWAAYSHFRPSHSPPEPPGAGTAPPGMVWIPGGEFTMGGDDPLARPDESPKHRVRVDGFFIDITELTNDQFAKF